MDLILSEWNNDEKVSNGRNFFCQPPIITPEACVNDFFAGDFIDFR
jgi:hypothetical protein